jgi:hypothetical protein
MKGFRKFLVETHARLEDIEKDPYPDPAVDTVTVQMLVERTNYRARKAGCGHLAVRRSEFEQYSSPTDAGLRAIERMLAWCQDQGA